MKTGWYTGIGSSIWPAWPGQFGCGRLHVVHVESPQDPSAGSYSPPGMGFRRLSKVVGFSIFLTEIALISAGVRKSKSTVSMAEEMGCEIFMMPDQQSSS